MNKRVLVLFLLLSLLMTSACGILEDLVDRVRGGGSGDYVASQVDRQMDPQVPPGQIEALINGNTQFAVGVYHQIREGQENLIFSPISLSLALSMAMAGAESQTETEMLTALQFPLPEMEVHPAFNGALLAVEASQNEGDHEGFQLNLANALWTQADLSVQPDFLDTLALNYGAGLYQVDFKSNPDAARRTINRWVARETHDHIDNILGPGSVDPQTRLVLANAIYFKAVWDETFDKAATAKEPFTRLDGKEVSVDMMKIWDEPYAYHQGGNYQAVTVDYLNPDFSMVILVPDPGAFTTVEDQLSAEFINAMLNDLDYQDLNLQMPKFGFDTQFEVTPILEQLGMSAAFQRNGADFSGITDEEPLFISSVAHMATISVDEEGTEAAAATTIMFGLGAAPPGEPITLIIDRPFIFFIVHEPTQSLLFMGRVLEP